MKNFTTYLSTAPVIALLWFTLLAAFLIELNRFFPDGLVFALKSKFFELKIIKFKKFTYKFSLLIKGRRPKILACLIALITERCFLAFNLVIRRGKITG